jgi:hypothetical protein
MTFRSLANGMEDVKDDQMKFGLIFPEAWQMATDMISRLG